MQEISTIAEPLLNSKSFNRLESITFLGILSPTFNNIITTPLFNRRSNLKEIDTGSRKTHSFGVALIALDLTRRLKLSSKIQKYAVAWGLLHDIATWPLSHTGEPAFSEITRVSSNSLREMMIKGSRYLPESLTLEKELREIGIDPLVLLSLLNKKSSCLGFEFQILGQILNSPLTPDSLDGIWRTGLAFGVSVPHPKDIINGLYKNLFDVVVKKECSKTIIRFWKNKSKIYERFINRNDIILWESRWSFFIKEYFKHLDLVESLFIKESDLINAVLELGLPNMIKSYRYKAPLSYSVCPSLKNKILNKDHPLDYLNDILKKEAKKEYNHGDWGSKSSLGKSETIYERANSRSLFKSTEVLHFPS